MLELGLSNQIHGLQELHAIIAIHIKEILHAPKLFQSSVLLMLIQFQEYFTIINFNILIQQFLMEAFTMDGLEDILELLIQLLELL